MLHLDEDRRSVSGHASGVVRTSAGDPWQWMRAQLRRVGARPSLARHDRALTEMASGDYRLDIHTLAGLANSAHAAYRRDGIALRVVRATWLAHQLDIIAVVDPACVSAMFDPVERVIRCPPAADQRAGELDLLHEIGEASVGGFGSHPDVWALTCALGVEQNVALARINRHGLAEAIGRVARRCNNLPAWSVACGVVFWECVERTPPL